ncbi:MAG: dephospho-CoA kinase [Bacteroidales bacterium]
MKKTGLIIGVTGGIGSGKTTVCRVFNALGVPVYAADAEASRIMETDASIMDKVNSIAGRNVYSGGSLDRKLLAGIIFNDKTLLEKINNTIHPEVRKDFDSWRKGFDTDYVILEAAILFESRLFGHIDRIITVTAPLEERIERVMRRSSLSRKEIMDRINNQTDDNYKIERSDFVIDNSDNKLIVPVILNINKEILKLVKAANNNG